MNRRRFAVLLTALLSLSLLMMISPGFATTYIYPHHGYPFYETDVDFEYEWATPVFATYDGDCRITPFNDAWSSASLVGLSIIPIASESMHGVGVDIYPSEDVDVAIWARGTYQLDGWVGSIGIASSTAAVILRIYDFCCGDSIYASMLIKEELCGYAGIGSYSKSGYFVSESLVTTLEGQHYYHVVVIARAATSSVGPALAYAHSAIDLNTISISVTHPGSWGGGCPNLLVSNGKRYFDEGVMSIHNIVNPDDDMVINHRIRNKVTALGNGYFEMLLSEMAEGYEYSHSFIDYVSLMAIDADGAWHECPLITACHSRDGDILTQLMNSDNIRRETFKGDEITLRFSAPALPTHIRSFVFILEGHNPNKV